MIRLAISDSPLARSLISSGRLDVDYLETSGASADDAATDLPGTGLLLHNSVWDWSLGDPQALEQPEVLETTRQRLARTEAPWLSVHLGFSTALVAFEQGMQAKSPPLEREALLASIIRNARRLAEEIEVPLLLENLDYNATGAYEQICEPDFIRAAVEQSESYFLLDLAHARVSAARLGYSAEEYLDRLPLGRVRQLHVSGPRQVDGLMTDVHESLAEIDVRIILETLARTEPWALTLEYKKDADTLVAQTDRLRRILSGQPNLL
jgi:uncharacterized protein (UPF0276 family)